MDFQRVILALALTFTLFMMWQAWEKDYGPKPVPTVAAPASAPSQRDVPEATGPMASGTPAAAAPSRPSLGSAQRVRIETDVFRGEIDTFGGDLRQISLPKYPVSVAEKETPVVLLRDEGELFVAQTGLLGKEAGTAPDHYATFTAAQPEYRLADGQETLEVPLSWTSANSGLKVQKIYTFHRGSYLVDVAYRIENSGAAEWHGNKYYQWLRSEPAQQSRLMASSYTGAVFHAQDLKYEKVAFDDMRDGDLSKEGKGGWAAMIQHYFLGAWVPPQEGTYRFYTKSLGENRYTFGMVGPGIVVAPGQTVTLPSQLYVGPKDQSELEKVAPGLELTVDYGWLTVIAKPLWWLLDHIHQIIGNWGWAIIVLTILIKLAFYKLSEASYKSMAQMRKLQPRLTALKERFGDDRQKMSEAMMKLYREEKINPLGGCLPVLVQIPVFIALYWVLLETVELRQAPWIFWIHDLSVADPSYVLPILMGVSMLVQTRLNPSPMDPIQAKVMMILPIVFTFFFLWFPAGLVLYWVVNNVISILQQWYITRWVVKA